jgi:hypothetical protein
MRASNQLSDKSGRVCGHSRIKLLPSHPISPHNLGWSAVLARMTRDPGAVQVVPPRLVLSRKFIWPADRSKADAWSS